MARSKSSPQRKRTLTFDEKVAEVEKRRVKKTRHAKLPKNRVRKGIHDMTAPVRGRCVIFANSIFRNWKMEDGTPNLPGYERDAENLQKVFDDLHFKVTVYKNRSAEKMRQKLRSVVNYRVREIGGQKPNAFVLIILSHGDESSIMGSNFDPDHEEYKNDVLKEAEIIDILNNENCPHLIDRPTLIFLQTCKGDRVDFGVSMRDPSSPDINAEADSQTESDSEKEAIAASANIFKAALASDSPPETSPTESEILIWYCSFVGRHGSVFGIALARALINNAHDTDIQSLINLISAEMKDESTPIDVNQVAKQVPQVTLKGWTKQLFFNPGYPKSNKRGKINSSAAVPRKINKSTEQRQFLQHIDKQPNNLPHKVFGNDNTDPPIPKKSQSQPKPRSNKTKLSKRKRNPTPKKRISSLKKRSQAEKNHGECILQGYEKSTKL
ncbi:Caspase-2 [Folsomia candida]|uniref:Caspase-2 n=1 Tax=Folsomia candida TaxID=158441 RepID=A0A226E4H4_FOLCA|nr:Caspase-2 [Folsomia candida]